LAKLRIEVADDEGEAYPPETPVHLAVRTRAGRRLEVAIRGAQGSPQRPLTLEDLRQKFFHLTHWMGSIRQRHLFEALLELPSASRLPRLTQ
jgi:2-methylcitrate dehydratase PrpD